MSDLRYDYGGVDLSKIGRLLRRDRARLARFD